MTGTYRIADTLVQITSLHGEVHALCSDYKAEGTPQLQIVTTQQDIDNEGEQSDATRKKEGLPPYTYPDGYLETLAVYRQLALWMTQNRDTLLLHGSCISVDGKAYLFTARSGTGKSTHVRLWRELFGNRAVMVNDDKPLVHVSQQGATIFGTPWNGKHQLGSNISAPLKAICILTRSEKNHIEELTPQQAMQSLLQQTHLPKEALTQALTLLGLLLKQVKLYRLGCNMNPEAAQVAFNGMNS